MSKDWVSDINDMHNKYGFHEWVKEKVNAPPDGTLHTFLKFRLNFLKEELYEMYDALDNDDPEEIVDGLIDLCVVAIGTLNLFDIDEYKAWDNVHTANMTKKRGIKPNRPNPLGVPDLMKPEGWVGPDHSGNHGYLPKAFE